MSDPLARHAAADRLRMAALRLDRPAALGLAVLAVVAVAVAVAMALHARPHAVVVGAVGDGSAGSAVAAPSPDGASRDASGSASLSGPASGPASAELVVDVVGGVRRPGLVRVPAGSRVWDAVQAAGGFRRAADAPTVNLARPLADGEQLVVGPPPPGLAAGAGAPPGAPAGAAGSASSDAPVDLNTATLEVLEGLPGVGPVLAQRILEHRTSQGPFRSVDELRDVSGIGAKKFADLAPHVRV